MLLESDCTRLCKYIHIFVKVTDYAAMRQRVQPLWQQVRVKILRAVMRPTMLWTALRVGVLVAWFCCSPACWL